MRRCRVAKRRASSVKRSKTGEASDLTKPVESSADSVATQVAEYVGTSLGQLLNERDKLVKQVGDLDQRIADARGRMASTIVERLPSLPSLPAIPALGGLRKPPTTAAKKAVARTERTGNRKKHRGKPETTVVPKEALKKLSAQATGRSAVRKRANARSSR